MSGGGDPPCITAGTMPRARALRLITWQQKSWLTTRSQSGLSGAFCSTDSAVATPRGMASPAPTSERSKPMLPRSGNSLRPCSANNLSYWESDRLSPTWVLPGRSSGILRWTPCRWSCLGSRRRQYCSGSPVCGIPSSIPLRAGGSQASHLA